MTQTLHRAVDEHGAVLDVFLQRHRDTDAAVSFFKCLLGGYDVPDTVCTDKLASYGAAIRELPVLEHVDHQNVISPARCNNLIEQRAGVHPGVRSAQDSLIVPPDVKSDSSLGSARSRGRKDFLTCTPESLIFTVLLDLLSPLRIAVTNSPRP